MSEKRFILKKCKLYDVVYNKDVAIATFKNVDDADVICSWLNELYDQNVQLLIQKKKVQDENKQLRQQVQNAKEIAVKNDMQYQICRKEKEDFQDMCEQLRRDEQLYAKEILRLKEELKEKEIVKLGGDY